MYEVLSDILLFSGIVLWCLVALVIVGFATGHMYLEREDADKT